MSYEILVELADIFDFDSQGKGQFGKKKRDTTDNGHDHFIPPPPPMPGDDFSMVTSLRARSMASLNVPSYDAACSRGGEASESAEAHRGESYLSLNPIHVYLTSI